MDKLSLFQLVSIFPSVIYKQHNSQDVISVCLQCHT